MTWRGLHGVVPLAKRRAYIPQLHGGKQSDPDGPAGQTRQPCERCQRQQVVDGQNSRPPERKTENSLIKEAGSGSVASVTPLAVMTLLTANAVSTAQTAHSAQ